MSRMNSRAALVAFGAALATAVPMASAEAQYYYRRNDPGAAIAGGVVGGVLGGLAAGAIINSTRPAPVYVAPPPPVYVAPEPVYVPTCHIVRRRVWLDDYSYTYRRERVCD